jgi:hypothetical protein
MKQTNHVRPQQRLIWTFVFLWWLWVLPIGLVAQTEPVTQSPPDTILVPEGLQAVADSLESDATGEEAVEQPLLLLPEDDAFGLYAFRKRTLDGTWQRVDSFVNVRLIDQFVLPYRSSFGLLPLANVGNGLQVLRFEGDSSHLSDFGMGVSEWGFRRIEELPFYDVKSPISDMQFITAYGRGQHFRMNFAQNLGPRWNYYASYDRINSLGDYPNNRTVADDFLITTQYTSPNRRLRVEGVYQFNKRILNEFGGLVNIEEFTSNLTPIRNQTQPLLSNTQSELVRNVFFSRQRYVLLRNKRDFLVSLENTMNVTTRRYTFNTANATFFPTPVTGLPTNDTIGTSQYDQQAGFVLGKQLPDGSRQELRVFGFYHYHQYGGPIFNTFREATGVGSEVDFQDRRDYIHLSGLFNLNLLGNQSGSVLRGDIRVGQARNWHLAGGILFSGRQADPFWETYRSNHYNWLNQNLAPVRTQRFSVGARKGDRFAILYHVSNLQNWLYLDTAGIPAQAGSAIQMQQLDIKADFKAGNWSWQNQGLLQRVTSSDDYLAIRVPDLVFRSTVFYNYSIIKGVLQGQVGLDIHYFSAFKATSYNPALNRFHLQDSVEIGNFPYVHAFATAQLKSFQFFIRLENLTEGLGPYNYFAAPGIPLPDRFVRLGFNWRFFE